MARELTLVDAGLGNLASVERALIQVGSATQITDDPDKVATARIVVFPGQGAFGKTTDAIVDGAMGEALRMVIQRGDPFLGICLGMQLLFEGSDEGGGHRGLGVLGGRCKRFPDAMTATEGERTRNLKIPHMGWNEVQPSGEHYYFVHSYYVDAEKSRTSCGARITATSRSPRRSAATTFSGANFTRRRASRPGCASSEPSCSGAVSEGAPAVLLIPAIDLLDGRAVRLAEGDRSRATVYSDEPWTLAAQFVHAGAKRIHVVDLDGAFAGAPSQLALIGRLLDAARSAAAISHGDPRGCEIEVGGGIRDAAAVERLIEAGVDKVVVGTLAVREPELVAELCDRFPHAIVVAIDARAGMVAVDGWREISTIPATELARQAAGWGAAALLYTDVSRDGLQVGAAVEATAALQAEVDRVRPTSRTSRIDVIASGGVGSLEHLDALATAGVRAVICGRALYERRFTLEEALARC